MDYVEFIAKKHIRQRSVGFVADESKIPEKLFDWQREIVKWATNKGRAAIFASCGMGKTAMQLSWARQVTSHTRMPVLILAPLAVNEQTANEGMFFGIEAESIRSMDEVKNNGIYIMNYEMISHITPDIFGGIVLDESSILKALTGKTKTALTDMFSSTPYRLCCTATPAPNDHAELGNHAEFLGVMRTPEMLSTWFVNDGFESGKWRLKGHAKEDFWEWVSSWAVCVNKPSDIGDYDDSQYKLPELVTVRHDIKVDETDFENGALIRMKKSSASTIKKDMRKTMDARIKEAASIVKSLDGKPCIVWCELNDESRNLVDAIPGAVEITGSMKPEEKSKRMMQFTNGEISTLITKPKIAGFGMNWQHCNNMIFVGCSYSFEARYQAIRRCWRFGQKNTVYDHVILAGQESKIFDVIAEKERKYIEMEKSMSGSFTKNARQTKVAKAAYNGKNNIIIPDFLKQEA